jgi:hypothetical protein
MVHGGPGRTNADRERAGTPCPARSRTAQEIGQAQQDTPKGLGHEGWWSTVDRASAVDLENRAGLSPIRPGTRRLEGCQGR